MSITDVVFNEHASENTKYHALYCYFFLRRMREPCTELIYL